MGAFIRPAQLFKIADRLRTSFWFLPSSLAVGAIIIAFGLIRLDHSLSKQGIQQLAWLYEFGPDGARAILAAVASSMITVAGLTFSITMLTLQLASSQYGPRILRNFMGDRGNQIVLGTFIATFVYCLLVLRAVRGAEGSAFVPHVSVAFGLLLAIASLAVLIYFIHHVASSIRIETLLAQLANEARGMVDDLYPEKIGTTSNRCEGDNALSAIPSSFERESCSIECHESGYIQQIDEQTIMDAAVKADLVVRLNHKPGNFVRRGESLITAHPRDRVSSSTSSSLRNAVVIGQERTPDQDVDFAVRRIVEIAQRALSPGVNDPTTAIYCLDRVHEVLAELAGRRIPGPLRYDKEGRLRIIAESLSFPDLACTNLAAVARYAKADADVMRSLRRVAEGIMRMSTPPTAQRIARFLNDLEEEGRISSQQPV